MVVRIGDVVNDDSVGVVYKLFNSPVKSQTSDSDRVRLMRARREVGKALTLFEESRRELLLNIGVDTEEALTLKEDKDAYYEGLYDLANEEVEIKHRLPIAALRWVEADFNVNEISLISYLLEDIDEYEC